jgi:hypothetical protein
MKFLSVLSLAAMLCACGARTSDEERVRELFASAEEAAEARDSSDLLALVADEYTDAQGLDKSSLRDLVRAWLLAHPKVELLVNVESLEFPADGLAQAEISIAQVALGDAGLERLRVELRRDGDEWRVVRADRRR